MCIHKKLAFLLIIFVLTCSNGTPIVHAQTETDASAQNVTTPNFTCATVTEIPQVECDALVTLYNSTIGPNWINHTFWLEANNPCDWHGITCADGHITWINLTQNNVSGTIPAQLSVLAKLEFLFLTGNHLNGSIPLELGALGNLQALHLTGNQLSGGIPPQLGNLAALQYLGLAQNQLNGTIPTELGNLTQLRQINLGENQFSGTIPVQFGTLVNLTDLWLYNNQLTGGIPPDLGQLPNLRLLDLRSNHLTGSIPPQLGGLAKLEFLLLGVNQLSQEIPVELGNLVKLRDLDLDRNQLRGTIPSTICNARLHDGADYGYNMLSAADACIESRDLDWAQTQTVPPKNLQAVALSSKEIQLNWTPIVYQDDGGYYVLLQGTAPSGPFTIVGQTSAKTVTGLTVNGLMPGTTYYFAVRTFTPSHGFQQNNLTSENSVVISATTHSIDNIRPIATNQTVTVIQDRSIAITLAATDGDNDSLTFNIITQPTHGALTGVLPSLTYTPSAGFTGNDSFTFQVSDGQEDSNIAAITITVKPLSPLNTAPVANSQQLTTILNRPISITLSASDLDNNLLDYFIISPPTNGALSGALPKLLYTPNPTFLGSDSFTFKVNDSKADSNEAIVTVQVTPEKGIIGGRVLYLDQPVVGASVTVADLQLTTDVNGDFTTPSLLNGRYEISATATVSGTALSINGEATIDGDETTHINLLLQDSPNSQRQVVISGTITLEGIHAGSASFISTFYEVLTLDLINRQQRTFIERCVSLTQRVFVDAVAQLTADNTSIAVSGEARLFEGPTCANSVQTNQGLGSYFSNFINANSSAPGKIQLESVSTGGLIAINFGVQNNRRTLAAATTIGAQRGGQLVTADNTLDLVFPPQRVAGAPFTVNYAKKSLQPVIESTPGLQRKPLQMFTLDATTNGGTAIAKFNEPYTLTVKYSDGVLKALGMDESKLGLAYHDGQVWKEILPCAGCSVDTVNNQVRVLLDHFTEFALVGNAPVDNPTSQVYLPLVSR